MRDRLNMFMSLTPRQRAVVVGAFAIWLLPMYAMFSVGNSVKANRVLTQVESMTLTNVSDTIKSVPLF